ncbi:MAG: DUF748 domain-containing protein [Elusimicrobia bacterium]|nr:DUF748 domain-containing protein [Elusimicrobiota bacterium]
MASPLTTSQKWIRRLAWVACAYAVIAAVAWATVPWAVRRTLRIVPKALPTFAAAVERVAFNPFTLRLTIEGLSLTQERFGELASCRSVSVALSPAAFLRMAVGLRELKLVGPRLTLGIGPDGSSVLDALPKTAPEKPAPPPKPAFIPRLVVGVLDISGGELNFESRLRSAPQRFFVRPIEFRLENLSTIVGDDGVHRLQARTDHGESIDWPGRMTVRPPRLWGRFELDHADLARLSSGAPDLPVDIAAGRLSASTDYDVALASETLTVSLKAARASITGLMWRLKAAKEGPRGPFALEIGPAGISVAAAIPPGRVTLDAAVPVAGTGQVRLKLSLTPKPLAGEADVEITALPLAPFSPLLPPPTQVSLDSGNLDVGLRAYVSGRDADGTLSLSLSGLKVSNRDTRRALVRVGRFAVESARLSTKARRFDVAAVRVEKPFLLLARGRDGKTNIESALGVSFSSAAAPAAAPTPAPAAAPAAAPDATASSGPPWGARLKRLAVSGGRVLVRDEAIAPAFALAVSEARLDLTGLSTDGRSTATFSGGARVEDARVSADGKVRLSTSAAWVEARLKGNGIQLPVFSPYSGKTIGYKIDKGAFSFDLDEKLAGRMIATKNHAMIDQLTLGEKVESPDATKAPVKLGLAILKDRRGVIDLDIPIDGSLDDPDFHVAGAILKTVVNLIVKAAVSPFAALGQMLGSKGDLGSVAFAAGQSALSPEDADQVQKVAQALLDRPQMLVGVRGAAGRSPDSQGGGPDLGALPGGLRRAGRIGDRGSRQARRQVARFGGRTARPGPGARRSHPAGPPGARDRGGAILQPGAVRHPRGGRRALPTPARRALRAGSP